MRINPHNSDFEFFVYTQIFKKKVMLTFFNISDIATDPPFWKVCYRFCTYYYGMLPRLGNIRRKPRVTRHNPSLIVWYVILYHSVCKMWFYARFACVFGMKMRKSAFSHLMMCTLSYDARAKNPESKFRPYFDASSGSIASTLQLLLLVAPT